VPDLHIVKDIAVSNVNVERVRDVRETQRCKDEHCVQRWICDSRNQ